jgi:hypothetical protein
MGAVHRNVKRLFERAQTRQLVIPTTPAQMQELTDLTCQDRIHRTAAPRSGRDTARGHPTVSDRRFYVVFLNTYPKRESCRRWIVS